MENRRTKYQKTLAQPCWFTGIALHNGGEVNVRLLPAAENTGIVFKRIDINATIHTKHHLVSETLLATVLAEDGNSVCMVEHLLSAIAAVGIDNLTVELDGMEMPILDGSSIAWIVLIDSIGLTEQKAVKKYIRVQKAIEIKQNERSVSLLPTNNNFPCFNVSIDYPHSVVNKTGLNYQFELSYESYKEEISRARTFCYVSDVAWMQRNNRALGGSLQNAIVYDDNKVINDDGLRYHNEFVRHKILDAIGDCYIEGHLILGNYVGIRPGHDLNNQLMCALFSDPNNWTWESAQ